MANQTRAISTDDISQLEKELALLPLGSQIISIYGMNGRHVAWIKEPLQESKTKTQNEGLKNGSSKKVSRA